MMSNLPILIALFAIVAGLHALLGQLTGQKKYRDGAQSASLTFFVWAIIDVLIEVWY